VRRLIDESEWDDKHGDEDFDGDDVYELRTHVSADVDTMLMQIKKYILEHDSKLRKAGFGDTAVDEPIKPEAKSRRTKKH